MAKSIKGSRDVPNDMFQIINYYHLEIKKQLTNDDKSTNIVSLIEHIYNYSYNKSSIIHLI